MKQILSADIINPELSEGAILNELMDGFKEDYLVLHCLLKQHKPSRFLEIGTNIGTGTQIIKNALGEDSTVFSLDLPFIMKGLSKQYPSDESGLFDGIGAKCALNYTQLRGNSLTYEYSWHYPLNGWFIDGEHDYAHAYHESREAIKSKAQIIIWHDADIQPVYFGVVDAFRMMGGENYELFRVADTRIAYALRK